jgi:hypothetical protein
MEKTNDESRSYVSDLQHSSSKENTRKIWWRRAVIALIIALLLLAYCDRKVRVDSNDKDVVIAELTEKLKEAENAVINLTEENKELKKENDHLESLEPHLFITRILTEEGDSATKVETKLVYNFFDVRSEAIIPDREIPCLEETEETEETPCVVTEEDCQEYIDAYTKPLKDSLNQIKNDSVDIALVKTTSDTSYVVGTKRISYYSFLHNPILEWEVPEPVVCDVISEYTYLAGVYREKCEKAVKRGTIAGVTGLTLYGATELAGHAMMVHGRDNSAAERKDLIIKSTRGVAAAFGIWAATEFAFAWHFHRMEAKFIIYPTEYGAVAGLSVNIPIK